MTTEPEWAKQYRARFTVKFGFDPESWEDVMRDDNSGWSDYELRQTMAWMQSKGQKWPKSPTAHDLVIAMRTKAKGTRVDDAPARADCAICDGTGCATIYPYVPRGGFDCPATLFGAHSASAPCPCTAGQRQFEHGLWADTGRTSALDNASRMAARQHAEIAEMWRTAPPAEIEDGETYGALAKMLARRKSSVPAAALATFAAWAGK